MKLDEILFDGSNGRALLAVPDYPVSFLLPNHRRDFHPMPRVQRWLVGTLTPAMTWRNGIAVNELAMGLGDPRFQVRTILHETCGHWWELWRRMGPNDFPATYGWQALLGLVKYGSAHLHATHPQEVQANRVADAILETVEIALRQPNPFTFDTLPWLAANFPALRA